MMDRGHELSMVSRDPETCCSTFFHFVFSSTSFRLPCVGSCLVWWPQSQTPSQAHLHPVPDLHPQQWSFAKPLHLGNRENGPYVLCLGQRMLWNQISQACTSAPSVSVPTLRGASLSVSILHGPPASAGSASCLNLGNYSVPFPSGSPL